MRGRVVPGVLASRPFTVSQGREAGLRARDLRTTRLHAPTHGVRTASVPGSLHDRAAAFAVGMPDDAVFSHVTAAQLLQLPLPRCLEAQVVLDVMRPSTVAQVRRRGCRGHRGLERRRVVEVDGLRVVAPADTWVDLGEVVRRGLGVDDLVVVGDVVASRLDGRTTGAEAAGAGRGGPLVGHPGTGALMATLDARVRPRGRVLLQEAVGLVRVGSRSPMETRARLMFHRAGFPEPELNAVVRDSLGGWLLEGDLVWRAHRVIGEYQGVDHGSIRRRSADSSRASSVEDHGWRVLEIFAEDVFAGARRRACLSRFARVMRLDQAALRIE